jgi:hypothetical protein
MLMSLFQGTRLFSRKTIHRWCCLRNGYACILVLSPAPFLYPDQTTEFGNSSVSGCTPSWPTSQRLTTEGLRAGTAQTPYLPWHRRIPSMLLRSFGPGLLGRSTALGALRRLGFRSPARPGRLPKTAKSSEQPRDDLPLDSGGNYRVRGAVQSRVALGKPHLAIAVSIFHSMEV